VTRRGRQTDLRQALESAIRRLDRTSKGAYAAARVISAWQEVTDGVVLAHTTGAHLSDGVLVVFVDGNSWAMHFSAMSETYRDAVNDRIGEELVSAVRFVVSRKVEEEHRLRRAEGEVHGFYAPDDVEPVALSEVEVAQVEASVRGIPDEELREAVLRATVRDLEWKKALSVHNGPQT
jgi:hypothetical protein